MSEIRFRAAVPADADAVRTCIELAYADARRDIADLPDVAGGVSEEIDRHVAMVAEIESQIVGAIFFGLVDDAVMIFNLAVSPTAQGRGLARQLMGFAERFAAEKGCKRLKLRTHCKMHGTIAMYRHMGWKEVEQGGNGIVMQKPVNAR